MWHLFVATAAGEHVHSSSALLCTILPSLKTKVGATLAGGVMCRSFLWSHTFLHEPSCLRLALSLDYHFMGITFMAQFVAFIAVLLGRRHQPAAAPGLCPCRRCLQNGNFQLKSGGSLQARKKYHREAYLSSSCRLRLLNQLLNVLYVAGQSSSLAK